MDWGILINFLLALGIGAIMGLEREIAHQKRNVNDFAGVRTFILIAILGFILTQLSINIFQSIPAFIVGFAAFMLLMIAAYTAIAFREGRIGATTEIASIITFLLAAMVTANQTQELKLIAIIIGIIVASLLALKEHLHKFAKRINMKEVYAAMKLALISVIILPLLPNKTFTLLDIPALKLILEDMPKWYNLFEQLNFFNPFKIWLVVVFISAMSFAGYIAIKAFGTNKGIGLTSILGGIVSSTAVTVSLAEKSKGKEIIGPYTLGIVLASCIMYIRVLIVILAICPPLFMYLLLPVGSMCLVGIVSSFIINKMHKDGKPDKLNLQSPFAITPALKFAGLLIFILAVANLLVYYLGNSGLYLASLISGLADVDAITISLSSLVLTGAVLAKVAALGVILAVCTNTLVKIGIVWFMGNKKLAKSLAVAFFFVILAGILVTLLL
jgi:uncharacterized membrane protein (DUF4010 family)